MNHIERAKELTPRQIQVVEFSALGCGSKQIARFLLIRENTIKHHKRNAFKTLGVKNMNAAITVCLLAEVIEKNKIENFYKGNTSTG